jgi:hypothetical protein
MYCFYSLLFYTYVLVQKPLSYFDVSVLCSASPWKWPYEWPKHVGGTQCVHMIYFHTLNVHLLVLISHPWNIIFYFFFFSSTNLYEFCLAQLFLSIVSSLAPSASNSSLPCYFLLTFTYPVSDVIVRHTFGMIIDTADTDIRNSYERVRYESPVAKKRKFTAKCMLNGMSSLI